MTAIVSITALIAAILAALACSIVFPIAFNTLSVSKTLVQSGNVTVDLISTTQDTLDFVNTTYRLYAIPNNYVIEIDPLPRELVVPSGFGTSTYVLVRFYYFSPAVIPLSSAGWMGSIYPFSPSNLDALVVQGPCFNSDPATCNVVSEYDNAGLSQNSLGAGVDENNNGYLYFYMQTLDSFASQDWANYTLNIVNTFTVGVFAA